MVERQTFNLKVVGSSPTLNFVTCFVINKKSSSEYKAMLNKLHVQLFLIEPYILGER